MSDKNDINFGNLCYYFDSTRRDTLDKGGLNARNHRFLALRDKLMVVSDEQFELIIRTLEHMVQNPGQVKADDRRERQITGEILQKVTQDERERTPKEDLS